MTGVDSPLLFRYLSGLEKGGARRSGTLFSGLGRLWLLWWQTLGCWVKALLTGICLCCRWGVGCLEPNPGCGLYWRTHTASYSGIPLLPLLALRYRFRHTGWLSSVSGLVPGGLRSVVPGCLGNNSWSESQLIQLSFPGGKDSGRLVSRD